MTYPARGWRRLLQVSQYIEFKDGGQDDPGLADRLKAEWDSVLLHPAMVIIVLFAARQHFLLTGKPVLITSLYRKKTTDSGVHEDWRGADLRCLDMTKVQRRRWELSIRKAFPYEYSSSKMARTVLIHQVRGEDGKSKGLHCHVQAGPLEPRPTEKDHLIA